MGAVLYNQVVSYFRIFRGILLTHKRSETSVCKGM
jgi:hypothetical protein